MKAISDICCANDKREFLCLKDGPEDYTLYFFWRAPSGFQ